MVNWVPKWVFSVLRNSPPSKTLMAWALQRAEMRSNLTPRQIQLNVFFAMGDGSEVSI